MHCEILLLPLLLPVHARRMDLEEQHVASGSRLTYLLLNGKIFCLIAQKQSSRCRELEEATHPSWSSVSGLEHGLLGNADVGRSPQCQL